MRRIARVVSLLALDYVGVTAAVFTALLLRMAIHGQFDLSMAWKDTKRRSPSPTC